MKKTFRILCLLLALVMCLGTLVACGDEPEDTTRQQVNTGNKWDDVYFDGKTLRVEMNEALAPGLSASGADTYLKYLQGPDSPSSEGVDNAVYERNILVANALGLTIEWKTSEVTAVNELLPHFESLQLSGSDKAPHIVVNMHYGLVRAEVNGLLYDMKMGYGTDINHFAFEGDDASGWYMDMMMDTTLNKDRIYIAAGDFLFDPFRLAYTTYVNTDMCDDLSDYGMDYLYDCILEDDGAFWTYDTMLEMSNAAYEPSTMPGETIYGTVAFGMAYRAFFFSSGLELFDYDASGKPSYITDSDKLLGLHNYVDTITTFLNDPSFAGPVKTAEYTPNAENAFTIFSANQALFMTDQFLAALEGDTFRGMDHQSAVIPYPKYDSDTPFRVLVSDNASSGGIFITCKTADFTAASAFLQMMTEESEEVRYEYYEEGLKFQNNAANDPRQIDVLDVIRDAIAEPLEFLFDNFSSRETPGTHTNGTNTDSHTIYDIIQASVEGKANKFSSTWDAEVGAKNNTLQSTIRKFYGN